MKKGFTVREKVLLAFLGVVVVCALYYYVFYLPTMDKINFYLDESVALEDQMLVAQTQVVKMNQMEKELEELLKNDGDTIVSLPTYDNSRQIVNELHSILYKATEFEVKFGSVIEEKDSKVVRRNIQVYFTATKYDDVKNVLKLIEESQYRCLIKNINISEISGMYYATFDVVYFEYKE